MMLDASMELDRLRRSLENKNYQNDTIEEVVSYAKEEISAAVSDILAGAISEAIDAGEEMDADVFLSEMSVLNVGSSFVLTTDSGKLDFSEPPFPMLPHLLKNPKMAKDGSLYKIIPIKDKKGNPKPSITKKTTIEAQRALDMAQVNNAQGRQARKHGAREGTRGMLDDAAKLAGFYNSNKPSSHKKILDHTDKGTAVEFRTASSKQDPLRNWAIPGKNKDMTPAVRRINLEMQTKISAAIHDIVAKYEEMY